MATSALKSLPGGQKADWIVSKEFSEILVGHPKIHEVFAYDRKNLGLGKWLKILFDLSKNEYTDVYDLHRSLRSTIARTLFRFFSPQTRWSSVSKQRLKTMALYMFKGFLPKPFWPRPWISLFAELTGGTEARADLPHFQVAPSAKIMSEHFLKNSQSDLDKDFLFLMPASQWKTKQWPVEKFVSLVESMMDRVPVVLGTSKDEASRKLSDILAQKNIFHLDLRSKLTLTETAQIFYRFKAKSLFVGNDTGLFHLAEAMGMKSFSIMGPTSSSLGFGPSTELGAEIGRDLGCRPCSKSGKICLRFWDQHACLKKLEANEVIDKLHALDGVDS